MLKFQSHKLLKMSDRWEEQPPCASDCQKMKHPYSTLLLNHVRIDPLEAPPPSVWDLLKSKRNRKSQLTEWHLGVQQQFVWDSQMRIGRNRKNRAGP
jgi:hypothetical protein